MPRLNSGGGGKPNKPTASKPKAAIPVVRVQRIMKVDQAGHNRRVAQNTRHGDVALSRIKPSPKDGTSAAAKRKRQIQQQATRKSVRPGDVSYLAESAKGKALRDLIMKQAWAERGQRKRTAASGGTIDVAFSGRSPFQKDKQGRQVVVDFAATAKANAEWAKKNNKKVKDPALAKLPKYTARDKENLKPRDLVAAAKLGPNPLIRQKGAPADYITTKVPSKIVNPTVAPVGLSSGAPGGLPQKGKKTQAPKAQVVPAKTVTIPNPQAGGSLNPLAATIGNTRDRVRNRKAIHHKQGSEQRAFRKELNRNVASQERVQRAANNQTPAERKEAKRQLIKNPYVAAPRGPGTDLEAKRVRNHVLSPAELKANSKLKRDVAALRMKGKGQAGLNKRAAVLPALKDANLITGIGPKEFSRAKIEATRQKADAVYRQSQVERRSSNAPSNTSGFGANLSVFNNMLGAETVAKAFSTGVVTSRAIAALVIENPIKFAGRTISDLGMMARSIPAGVVATALHPLEVAKVIKNDYVRRYGDVFSGGDYQTMLKRLRKEGATAEMLDLITVVTITTGGVGKGVQLLAKSGMTARAATGTGRVAQVAKVAKSVATERPGLAIGGGAERTQKISKNFFINAARRGIDKNRETYGNRVVARREAKDARNVARSKETGRQLSYNDRATIPLRVRQTVDANGGVITGRTRLFGRKAQGDLTTSVKIAPAFQRILKDHVSRVPLKGAGGADLKRAIEALPDGTKKSQELRLTVEQANKFDNVLAAVRKNSGASDLVPVRWGKSRHQAIRAKLGSALENQKAWKVLTGGSEHAASLRSKLRQFDGPSSAFKATLTPSEGDLLARVLRKETDSVSGPQAGHFRAAATALENDVKVAAKTANEARGADLAGSMASRTSDARRIATGGWSEKVVPARTGMKFGFGSDSLLRRTVADVSARAFVGLKVDQQQMTLKMARLLKPLSKDEKQALFYGVNHGLVNPTVAKKWLVKRRAQIIEARKNGDDKGTYDELPTLDYLLKNADTAFTPQMARVTQQFRQTTRKVGEADPSLTKKQIIERELGPQARLLGVDRANFTARKLERLDGETADVFQARQKKEIDNAHEAYVKAVHSARRREGLVQPGFWRGEIRPRDVYSVRAVGGARAMAADKKMTYQLIDTGRTDMSPEVFVRGVMSNIKRSHNWKKVADVYDKVTLEGYRNMTLSEIQQAVDRGDLSLSEIALWNPGKYRENLTIETDTVEAARRYSEETASKASRGMGYRGLRDELKPNVKNDPDTAWHYASPNDLSKGSVDPVRNAVTGNNPGGEGRVSAQEFSGSNANFDFESFVKAHADDPAYHDAKWSVVSGAAHKEIMASTKPSNAFARSWDIGKGKISRVLLFNPAWLQFQIASNAFLTGLTGVGPISAVKASVWWSKLTQEERRALSPYIGVHRWYDEQTHLGAARFGSGDGVLTSMRDTHRSFKESPFYQAGLKNLNPLDAVFRADNAQNNFFRKAVFYNEVKRAGYKKLGDDAGQLIRLQTRLFDVFDTKGGFGLVPHFEKSAPKAFGKGGQTIKLERAATNVDAMIRDVLKDPAAIVKHAEKVNDMLGNWMTYTNAERRYLSRAVMFYGFVRFSTKLTFYTMPAKHPVMSEILLKLGSMQKDELEKMFGVDVPWWEIGNYYHKNADGSVDSYQVTRMNPFMGQYNMLVGSSTNDQFKGGDPAMFLQALPPIITLGLDQAFKAQGSLGGKKWTVGGSTADVSYQSKGVTAGQRANIFLGGIARLSPFYRALEQRGIPELGIKPLRGKQSTDSTIWNRQPTKYKRSDAVLRNQRLINAQNKDSSRKFLQSLVSPISPSDGKTKIESSRQFDKYQKDKKNKGKKVKPVFDFSDPKSVENSGTGGFDFTPPK